MDTHIAQKSKRGKQFISAAVGFPDSFANKTKHRGNKACKMPVILYCSPCFGALKSSRLPPANTRKCRLTAIRILAVWLI